MQLIKLTLMNDHNLATRNWTDADIIKRAVELGIDTSGAVAPVAPEAPKAPKAPVPAPPVIPVIPVETQGTTIAAAINAAINAALATSQPAINEPAIIELIKQYAPTPEPRLIEVKHPDQSIVTIDGVTHEIFDMALNHINCFPNQLFLYGESGSGKSYTAKQIAQALDMPIFSMGAILTKFETLGSVMPHKYVKSVIRNWLESNKGLLLIDEIDSSNPAALVTIMAMFDDEGSVSFPDDETFKRDARTHPIIVTANTTGNGASPQYNGRARLDAAFRARFVMLKHGYNDRVEDTLAPARAVRYVRAFRAEVARLGFDGSIVTPRHTKMIGDLEHIEDQDTKLIMINNILKQGLSDDQFTSLLTSIGAY